MDSEYQKPTDQMNEEALALLNHPNTLVRQNHRPWRWFYRKGVFLKIFENEEMVGKEEAPYVWGVCTGRYGKEGHVQVYAGGGDIYKEVNWKTTEIVLDNDVPQEVIDALVGVYRKAQEEKAHVDPQTVPYFVLATVVVRGQVDEKMLAILPAPSEGKAKVIAGKLAAQTPQPNTAIIVRICEVKERIGDGSITVVDMPEVPREGDDTERVREVPSVPHPETDTRPWGERDEDNKPGASRLAALQDVLQRRAVPEGDAGLSE